MDKEFIAQAKERIDALISRLGDPDLFPDEKAELLAELRREVDGLKFAEDAERARAQKEKEERERLEREREEQEERERREAHAKEVTCTDLPVDWVNVFDTDDRTFGVHFDSCADGLIASLSNLGRVDIEYIASVTGRDYKAVIGELKGAILQNPETWQETFYKGWETTEEYLSGNLMRKLRIAREANEQYCGYFADNVAAIEEVLPAAATAKDIHAALGSPWLRRRLHLFPLRRAVGVQGGERGRERTNAADVADKTRRDDRHVGDPPKEPLSRKRRRDPYVRHGENGGNVYPRKDAQHEKHRRHRRDLVSDEPYGYEEDTQQKGDDCRARKAGGDCASVRKVDMGGDGAKGEARRDL